MICFMKCFTASGNIAESEPPVTGIAIGVGVGGLVLLVAIIIVTLLIYKRKR